MTNERPIHRLFYQWHAYHVFVYRDNVRNEEQIKAMEKLRKLQEAMLEGGKRAGDKDLKERRLKKKKAAEKRLKVMTQLRRRK